MNSVSLSRWLLFGEWRAHFVQMNVALIAIAIGVAMAFSIHLINTAAFNEFAAFLLAQYKKKKQADLTSEPNLDTGQVDNNVL